MKKLKQVAAAGAPREGRSYVELSARASHSGDIRRSTGESRIHGGATAQRLVYVTKVPPSPSGIALYALAFRDALAQIGSVETLAAPSTPAEAQRLRSAVAGAWRGATLDLRSASVVHIELSGRSLFEFYLAIAVLLRRKVPVSITCHDAPSLVGPPMLFACLDRRGGRRIGQALSLTLGAAAERYLIGHCSEVFTLTEAGASALEATYGRPITALPHAVRVAADTRKEPLIFVPGPVGNAHTIADLVRVAHRHTESGLPFRVAVGQCSDATESAIRSSLTAAEAALLERVGFVSEGEWLGWLARSAYLVQLHGDSNSDNSFAMSGPIMHGLAAGCICIADDVRAGATELDAMGLICQTGDPAGALDALITEGAHRHRAAELVQAANRLFGPSAVASQYAASLGLSVPAPA